MINMPGMILKNDSLSLDIASIEIYIIDMQI